MVSSGLVDRVDVSHFRLSIHLLIAFLILSLIFWNYLKYQEYEQVLNEINGIENSLYKNIVLGRFNDMSSNVGKAVSVAKEYITKLDKGGKPVYVHALRIASALDLLRYDEDYIVTAILHDIIEDSDRDLGDILFRFNKNVRKAISNLTRKKSETYFEYIERVSQGSELAKKVKQFDVYDHLYFKENINDSLIKRYETASNLLNTKLENGIISEEIKNG